MKTPNLEHIRNDCPANHGKEGCFITRSLCQYTNKWNCSDYVAYMPKRYTTPHPYQRPKENWR